MLQGRSEDGGGADGSGVAVGGMFNGVCGSVGSWDVSLPSMPNDAPLNNC